MSDDDRYQQLMRAGLRFLSLRPRSEYEFIQFLHKTINRKKLIIDQSLFTKLVQRVKELEYIDDRKFAIWWIEQRDTHKPKSYRLIKNELRHKGIDAEIIEEVQTALSGIDQSHTELHRARAAIQKKLRLWKQLPVIEQKKKLFGFLGSRGFSSEICYTLVDEMLRKE